MRSRLIVSAIIEHNGKYLFGQKPKDVGPYPNTWHLLGGGVEPEDESLVDALRREIREEANLELSNIQSVGFDEDVEANDKGELVHYIFLVYLATATSNNATAQDDINQLEWFAKEEVATLSLARPSIKLFKKLGWM